MNTFSFGRTRASNPGTSNPRSKNPRSLNPGTFKSGIRQPWAKMHFLTLQQPKATDNRVLNGSVRDCNLGRLNLSASIQVIILEFPELLWNWVQPKEKSYLMVFGYQVFKNVDFEVLTFSNCFFSHACSLSFSQQRFPFWKEAWSNFSTLFVLIYSHN